MRREKTQTLMRTKSNFTLSETNLIFRIFMIMKVMMKSIALNLFLNYTRKKDYTRETFIAEFINAVFFRT